VTPIPALSSPHGLDVKTICLFQERVNCLLDNAYARPEDSLLWNTRHRYKVFHFWLFKGGFYAVIITMFCKASV